jgi:membrane-bound ClpP family serine protease
LVALALILMLVHRWIELPQWLLWGGIALWIAKDVILFPFVWRAYDRKRSKESDSMIGAQGIAEDRLAPSGYVRVRGELWQAEAVAGSSPIERGVGVSVRGMRGLTLLVKPDNGKETPAERPS